jgi:hypothetical protein
MVVEEVRSVMYDLCKVKMAWADDVRSIVPIRKGWRLGRVKGWRVAKDNRYLKI